MTKGKGRWNGITEVVVVIVVVVLVVGDLDHGAIACRNWEWDMRTGRFKIDLLTCRSAVNGISWVD